MKNNITDDIASRFLGKKADGSDVYNPDFLVAVQEKKTGCITVLTETAFRLKDGTSGMRMSFLL